MIAATSSRRPTGVLAARVVRRGRLRFSNWAAVACAFLFGACAFGAHAAPGTAGAHARPLTVFAAASLKESLDEAAETYTRERGQTVRVSYAASSILARQIGQGAPADVFVSADRDWMDFLAQRDLVDEHTRRDLLGNTLVLVAPRGADATPVVLGRGGNLSARLGRGRLALASTAGVPAGKYARAGLQSLGLWRAVAPRVAESDNVRAALMLVARGEAALGAVYASDAHAEPRVRIVATFPEASHPPIVYPVARVAASTHPGAAPFVAWLATPAAGAIFRRHGFRVP